MMNRDFFSKAKTKLRTTLLVILFITIIVSIFFIFATLQNNSLPLSASLVLLFTIIPVILLFLIAIRFTSRVNKEIAEIIEVAQETNTSEKSDSSLTNEKNPEIIIDLKKCIPKEKNKIETFADELLCNIAAELQIVQAVFYIKDPVTELFTCSGKFAYYAESNPAEFKSGETLPGQAVKNKSIVTIKDIPENYMIIASGLGKGTPGFLTFVPIISHDEVIGLIEFATFVPISSPILKALTQFSDKVADSIIKFIKK
jgi:hypothetical protein